MSVRLWLVFLVALSTGCGRRGPQPVGSVAPEQAKQAAAQMAAPPQGADPEPVERAVPEDSAPDSEEPAAVRAPAGAPLEAPAGAPPQYARSRATDERPAQLTIPAGTRIRVRLAATLDTRRTRPGERFTAYLDDPIVSGDRVVVPKGTTFEGHVTEAKNSGRLKGRAYLGIRLDSFRLRGVSYPIVTGADVRSSRSHKRRNLAFIGGGSGGGAAIGALAGGGMGALIGAGVGAAAGTTGAYVTGKKNVRLPVETPLVFSLRRSVTVRS